MTYGPEIIKNPLINKIRIWHNSVFCSENSEYNLYQISITGGDEGFQSDIFEPTKKFEPTNICDPVYFIKNLVGFSRSLEAHICALKGKIISESTFVPNYIKNYILEITKIGRDSSMMNSGPSIGRSYNELVLSIISQKGCDNDFLKYCRFPKNLQECQILDKGDYRDFLKKIDLDGTNIIFVPIYINGHFSIFVINPETK